MAFLYEAECIRGTADYVEAELNRVGHKTDRPGRGGVPFGHSDRAYKGEELRLATSVYRLLRFDLPRPKALLGHQHFTQIVRTAQEIMQASPDGSFRTMRLSAAGRGSSVMTRIRSELSKALELEESSVDGDLFIRIRRAAGNAGWDVLIRTAARPLTDRSWRIADMPGALNGTLAALMNELADIQPGDKLLNGLCGSGTLLIEQNQRPALQVGGDISDEALHKADYNLRRAKRAAELMRFNGEQLPFASEAFDVVSSDLPWGQLIGSHDTNKSLYRGFVQDAARLLKPNGRLVLITHEIRLLEKVLDQTPSLALDTMIRLEMEQLRPRIYKLIKTGRY